MFTDLVKGRKAAKKASKRDEITDERLDEIMNELFGGGEDEDERKVKKGARYDLEKAAEDMDDEDNVGDISVEINVEELVAKLEATDNDDVARRRDIRRRLEELEEMRRESRDLDSTFNFDLDDDL